MSSINVESLHTINGCYIYVCLYVNEFKYWTFKLLHVFCVSEFKKKNRKKKPWPFENTSHSLAVFMGRMTWSASTKCSVSEMKKKRQNFANQSYYGMGVTHGPAEASVASLDLPSEMRTIRVWVCHMTTQCERGNDHRFYVGHTHLSQTELLPKT